MRIPKAFALIGVAALVVGACSSTGATPSPSTAAPTQAPATASAEAPSVAPSVAASTLTVWLMNGSAADSVTAAVNKDFESSHPGVKVDYQVQQWNGIVDKLTTALASDNPPCVVELGNTQTAAFSSSGALADLTAKRADLGGGTSADGTSADELWLGGLNDSSMWQDKLYAVPFYAGTRVVVYNKDQFAKAGIDPATITSKDKLIAAAKKLQDTYKDVKDYSGLYLAGQNWYTLLSFLWDRGGEIATQGADGKWTGALESAEAAQGIQDYVDYFNAGSTGPKDNDEANPEQAAVLAAGKAGMMIANLWEIGTTIGHNADMKDKLGVFAIPSATDGKTAPVFLGGSNVAIPAGCKDQASANDWLKLLTGEQYMKANMTANGVIPNTKALASTGIGADNPNLQVAAAAAAAGSKITPNDPKWTSVEAGANPLKDMLTAVLTKQASIADAAKAADAEITSRMGQ
jgi:N,N'-diacetylchitobiose transport system substrate-binding protein